MSRATTSEPANRSTSCAVARLVPASKWRSVHRISRASTPESALAALDGGVHDLDHLGGRELAVGVQVRSEAHLGVDDAVGGELVEQVGDDHLEAAPVLHQRDDPGRPQQEVDQVRALGRRDEVGLVLRERHLGPQACHRGVAGRAVQVQVELDLRQRGHRGSVVGLVIRRACATRQHLIFDADDTLWENNVVFEGVIADFITWIDHPRLAAR